jgi:RNA polymerase sigma-70 factor (ECF subfamily)
MNNKAVGRKPRAQGAISDQDFEDIVAENESKIFNTIYSFVGNYEDALNLTQETFINAYRHIDRFRHESDIYTWLYRIAINLCKKDYNRKRRQNLVFISSLDDPKTLQYMERQASECRSPIKRLELGEEQSLIRQEIASLSKKHRTVIILKYMQDLSYEEIADIIGCSIGTVKSRLSRAKEKLKRRLERAMGLNYDKL